MSKEGFETLVGLAQESGIGVDKASILSILKDFDYTDLARVLQSKEMHRLLLSNEMKEAVDVVNISGVSEMYEEVVLKLREQTTHYIGKWIGQWLGLSIFYGVPVFLLIGAFGFFAHRIMKSYWDREQHREDKKMMRQLKRENNEAQRRLKTNPESKKRS